MKITITIVALLTEGSRPVRQDENLVLDVPGRFRVDREITMSSGQLSQARNHFSIIIINHIFVFIMSHRAECYCLSRHVLAVPSAE